MEYVDHSLFTYLPGGVCSGMYVYVVLIGVKNVYGDRISDMHDRVGNRIG